MANKPTRVDDVEDKLHRLAKSAPSNHRPINASRIQTSVHGISSYQKQKSSGVKAETTKAGAASSEPDRPMNNNRPTNKSKPSDRLNPKVIDPFYKTAGSTSKFASLYSSGAVPCRLIHGSVKHKLHWDTPPDNLNFDPLLVTLAEGLRESRHPYHFIAKEGFKQLLEVENAEIMAAPILSRLMAPIRIALASTNKDIFRSTLEAIAQLSLAVGSSLNPHLKSILPALGKQILSKEHKEIVLTTLQHIESNGGKESSAIIKSRIPTYSSVYH